MSSSISYVLEFKGVGEYATAFSKAAKFLYNCALDGGCSTLFDKLDEHQISDSNYLESHFKNTNYDGADCHYLGALACVLLPTEDWVEADKFIWRSFISGAEYTEDTLRVFYYGAECGELVDFIVDKCSYISSGVCNEDDEYEEEYEDDEDFESDWED